MLMTLLSIRAFVSSRILHTSFRNDVFLNLFHLFSLTKLYKIKLTMMYIIWYFQGWLGYKFCLSQINMINVKVERFFSNFSLRIQWMRTFSLKQILSLIKVVFFLLLFRLYLFLTRRHCFPLVIVLNTFCAPRPQTN